MQQNPYIPLFTTKAGSCLTLANWQELGIQRAAFSLDALLMKPGYTLLQSFPSLQSYYGWEGTTILNATLALAKSQDFYKLRSHYDGSIICLNPAELVSLITQLAPNIAILPPGLFAYLVGENLSLPMTIQSLIPFKEFKEAENFPEVGFYFTQSDLFLNSEEKETEVLWEQCAARSTYFAGPFNLLQAQELVKKGASAIETDSPAADALSGLLYGEEGMIELLASELAHQHKPILPGCSCPTCSQGYTQAYLHHLFQQTPLLAHRYLIQHNAHFYQYHLQIYQESR